MSSSPASLPQSLPAPSSLAFVRALVSGQGLPQVASAQGLRDRILNPYGPDTIEQAALGGLGASTVGWAFACGYESALRRLGPQACPEGHLVALCASEQGGGHPSAIRAMLSPAPQGGWELSGDKSWVTLGADAETLLVVASTGQDAKGRNRLRVARVPANRPGVTLSPGVALPFAPEIGHAGVALRAVRIADDEILVGDGYDEVLKPFRTMEDAHVLAAIVGWAIGVARQSAWSGGWIERAVGAVVALRAVGRAAPLQPETHLALAGAMDLVRGLLATADWASAPESTRMGWERDRPLLDVARKARDARLAAAWRALTEAP